MDVRSHVYDVDIDSHTGSTHNKRIRKECWRAFSAFEEVEKEGEFFLLPVGEVSGTFGDEATVGSELHIMFRNKLTDDEDKMLELLNRQADGSVLEPEDEGFVPLCKCFEEDGKTEMDCSD